MMTVALLVELYHQTHLPLPAFGEAKARLEKYGNPVSILSYFVVRCFPFLFYTFESQL